MWEVSYLDAEDQLNSDHIYDNSETVEPDSKPPVIVTAIEKYVMLLLFCVRTKLTAFIQL